MSGSPGDGAAGDPDLTGYLRPGDTVVVGQAAGEPPALVRGLIRAARTVDDLTAICGYTLSDGWAEVTRGRPWICAYVAHGALRSLGPDRLEMMPEHMSRMEPHVRDGRIPADVVLLQVGPADADGYHDLGVTVDYVSVAAERARVVLVEVNENMPRTRATRRLHSSLVTAAFPTSAALAGSPARAANEVEYQVAENVAALVPDGAVLQFGASSLAEATAARLRTRRGLRIRSGLVGDWLVGMAEAGALADGPGTVTTGMALGTSCLYDFVAGSDRVEFAPIHEHLAPVFAGHCPGFMAINSTVEVDLQGQLNSEVGGRRYVGAIGGQVDYFRAAQHSAGGVSIVALASTSASGASRVVARLDGVTTTSLKSDVDVVVTEWGVADLRACTFAERARRLAAVAHPQLRADLLAQAPRWG